jgi:hypothetical protein
VTPATKPQSFPAALVAAAVKIARANDVLVGFDPFGAGGIDYATWCDAYHLLIVRLKRAKRMEHAQLLVRAINAVQDACYRQHQRMCEDRS